MRHCLTIALCSLLFLTAQSQSMLIPKVTRFVKHNTGYIRDNETLVGYYSFYQYDKVDRKNNAYMLRLMDNNLTVVKDIEMTRPNTESLLEMSYNGAVFCMLFLDTKAKSVTLETYDRSGTRLGKANLGDKLKYELYRVQMAGEGGEVNESLFPLGKDGFMKHLTVKDDNLGFQLLAYDNDMKPTWKYSGVDAKMHVTADVIAVTGKYIVLSLMRQKSRTDKPDHATLLVIDAQKGTKVFSKDLTDAAGNMSALNGFVDTEKDEMLLIGEYFGPKDNIISDRSEGLYAMVLGTDGTQQRMVRYHWKDQVSRFVPPDKGGDKEVGLIFFHRVVRGQDGGVYLIGEQYKKVFSMNQDAVIKTEDMVVISLDPELALKEYKVVDKGRSSITIPGGNMMNSAATLAKYVKVLGGFDYAFTITDKANDRWFSSFVDFTREKGDDGKKIGSYVGTIISDKGNITTDRFDANSKATYYSVLPGKAGYIVIYEYKRKEQTITYRLEKVNY